MKLPLLFAFTLITGCAAPRPATHEYAIDDCGSFTGAKAYASTHCNGTDTIVAASCAIDGGPVETSRAADAHSWECATTWNDSARGGSICVQLECETVDAGAAR